MAADAGVARTSLSTGAAWPWRAVRGARLLVDTTYRDADGERRCEQMIFDELLRLIAQARSLVVLDQFLFNDFAGSRQAPYRRITDELTRALCTRKAAVPGLRVILITDPFNTLYGGVPNRHLEQLRAAGVEVVLTPLARLRDPNPAWSWIWRIGFQWAGNSERGWLPNPVGAEPVSLRSWMALLNVKANHRKTLVVDHGGDWAGLVSSANPHNASSAHSNMGLSWVGPTALDLLQDEARIAAAGGVQLQAPRPRPAAPSSGPAMRVITESAIRDAVLASLAAAQAGESIELALFYLGHRGVIRALKHARERGARIRVLLDPNREAFGRQKGGIPNRAVARELAAAGISVRWYATRGEQAHTKMLLHNGNNGWSRLILGSANFTRRNLDDLNLECDLELYGPGDQAALADARATFERHWNNEPGRQYSLAYETHPEPGLLTRLRYRLAEATGLSTF